MCSYHVDVDLYEHCIVLMFDLHIALYVQVVKVESESVYCVPLRRQNESL